MFEVHRWVFVQGSPTHPSNAIVLVGCQTSLRRRSPGTIPGMTKISNLDESFRGQARPADVAISARAKPLPTQDLPVGRAWVRDWSARQTPACVCWERIGNQLFMPSAGGLDRYGMRVFGREGRFSILASPAFSDCCSGLFFSCAGVFRGSITQLLGVPNELARWGGRSACLR